MKSKYILLIIGILGILSSLANLINGEEFTDSILGFVCGSSLIWGYFELKKAEEKK